MLQKLLKDHGAAGVKAYITHPVLSGPAIERINNSEIDELSCNKFNSIVT